MDVETNSNENVADVEGQSQPEEKETNKMFSQSEFDKHVAAAIRKEREKYKDYGNIKSEYEKMQKTLREKEMSEKSEYERLQIELDETKRQYAQEKSRAEEIMRHKKRSDVLSEGKYANLPRAYKAMVELSDDDDYVRESADKILEEYQKDIGVKMEKSFGIPPSVKELGRGLEINNADSPEKLSAALKGRLKSILNQRS
jgi:hypothetical protein